MNFEQLQQQWQQESRDPGQNDVKKQSNNMMDHFELIAKQAKQRTFYGSCAFFLIAAFLMAFSYLLYLQGAQLIILTAITSWIAILATNIARLWYIRSREPDTDLTTLQHLKYRRANVATEQAYYRTLWKWLTLPMGIGLTFLIYGLNPLFFVASEVLYLVAYCLFGYWGHQHCKNHLANQLTPLAVKLQKALLSQK